MNKGFFMPLQDKSHKMLKDEPEILDRLAPSAGDACIPLEDDSPFGEMLFNDFLNDDYCNLPSFLGDDLANGSPVGCMTPDLLLSSPESRENDSSCEQSSLLTELSLDAFDSTRSDNDIDDGNSPFIPTNDELPVLEPAVMWGALPDNVSLARPQRSEPVTVTSSPAPALQRLLTAATTGPTPQDLISNIYSDQGLIPSRILSPWDTRCKRVLIKQEHEPCAKRIKRSPSPAQQKPTSNQSSSVLMNLLDQQPQVQPNYRMPKTQLHQAISKGVPTTNIIQAVPTSQIMRTISPTNQAIPNIGSPMTPLSLNIGSPLYSHSSSPNYSPAVSPAQRVMSPYTPQSMSPVGNYQEYSPNRLLSPMGVIQGSDPYLTKMQPSPILSLHNELMLESNQQMSSSDFWADPELMQTSDLLTAFDDVKLG